MCCARQFFQNLGHITEKQSIFYRRELEAMALTLAVGRANARAVRRAIELMLTDPEIVDLHENGMLRTELIVEQEQEIVQIARQRQNERAVGFSKAARVV
jgi:hypothetical protein